MDRKTFAARAVIPLVVVLAAGAEARFVGLSSLSLWFDEAFSISLARNHVVPIILFLASGHDAHPPLYYVLLSLWIHLFGSSEAAARSLSAVIGLVTIPLLYVFARRLVDGSVALLSAALFAGSAFAALAAREARMYPLLGLLALGAWHALLRALEEKRAREWALYVVATTLMLYTHYYGFLVLASQGVYLSLRWRDHRTLRDAGIALGAVIVFFSPWIPSLVALVASGGASPTFRPPVDLHNLAALMALFGWGGELLKTGGYFHISHLPVWAEGLVIVSVLGMVGLGGYALRGPRAWLLMCYWAVPIILSVAISQRANIFYPRYFSFLVPPFAVLLAAGIDYLAAAALPRIQSAGITRPSILAACAVAFVGLNAPVINGYTDVDYATHDWRSAAELVTAEAGPRDYLLYVPAFAKTAFTYYYKGSLDNLPLTPVEVYAMVRQKRTADPGINHAWALRLAEDHPRVWIVATVPLPAAAFVRLRRLLGDDFDAGTAWDFHSVYVVELKSRVYRGDAKPQ
jgi:mannosyltransferase